MLMSFFRHRRRVLDLYRTPAQNRGRILTFAKMRQLLVVLLKHLFEHVIGFVDVLHDLFGCATLSTQVADDQQERRHSIQASNRFPTHRLIDVKQHPIPTIESRSLNDRVA